MPSPTRTPAVAPPSVDDVDRLRVALLRLSRRIRANSVGELTQSQVSMFATILKSGPCTIGQLAELEHIKAPSASKILAGLEAIGFVERHDDPGDRRVSVIAATAAGREYFDTVRAAGRGWLADRLVTLDARDIAAIQRALPALERLVAADS